MGVRDTSSADAHCICRRQLGAWNHWCIFSSCVRNIFGKQIV